MGESSALYGHLSGPAVLFQAIRSRNSIEVKRLIEDQGVAVSSEGPLDETDDIDVSALHLACWLKYEEIASVLLDLGADIESYDEMGSTPLLYSCKRGLLSIVKKLLAKKCNVLLRNKKKETALHHGCEAGNVDICSLLLDSEAWLDAHDFLGKTPLHWACEFNKFDAVKLLIEHGADIEAHDCWKRTPFLTSCAAGNVEIMKYLSAKGCDMTATADAGAGALHLACLGARTEAMAWLVSAGFNYRDSGTLGSTTLLCACEGGHLDLAVSLADEHGLDLDQRGENGMTPFLSAVVGGNCRLVEWLQDKECEIWVRNQFGKCALHLALEHSKENVFFFLFQRFCDEGIGAGPIANRPAPLRNYFGLESVNDNGETLFLVACKEGLLRAVKFLYQKGANIRAKDKLGKSGLHLSCENGHTPTAEYLMGELKLNPEETDYMSETSLMKACRGGHIITTKMLLESRIWDLSRKNKDDQTALHLACRNVLGVKVARFLIDLGINVTDSDCRGWTPIMKACLSGQLSIVRILAALDSRSMNQKNSDQQSLLHLACKYGHHGVSQFLIDSHVALDECDKFDCTPLIYACQSGLLLVAKRLVELGCSLHYDNSMNAGLVDCRCLNGGGAALLRFLVNSGVDFNQKYLFQLSLMAATTSLSAIKFLASLNSSLASVKFIWGESALHQACKGGHTSVADFLISVISDNALADFHRGDKTPLVYAYENGLLPIVRRLESRGCSLDEETLLMAACSGGLISVVKHIVERNRSVVRDAWRYFTEACARKRADVADLLINEFAHELLVENGSDALFVACENGCLCVVDRLVTLDCSLDDRTSDGANLLLLACSKKHAKIVHLLLDAGATADESKLLETATKHNMLSVIARLCDIGCSLENETSHGSLLHLAGGRDVAQFFTVNTPMMLNKLDSELNTPLMTACQLHNFEVATHLIESDCSVNEKMCMTNLHFLNSWSAVGIVKN
ncbi:serine/threonine-protein phosphatase 6 regulatory ankyrin repeat subunit B-like [Oscarella lobularis]|uniref:serine/threonine-protein phosphatase 6 regulatory ankyrin repeat subunit B-like n=1 Tax=Oscarella lobularis TaxID=121494 RepID=UPI00331368C1